MAVQMVPGKKTFEFRMSKKVAELTQVVHMLFTRNHEKEVEIEALRDAYEHEIELVIADARRKIDDLETRLHLLERSKDGAEEHFQARLEQELASRGQEWRVRKEQLETQIQEEKVECQNSHDLLIQARRDMESLREAHVQDLAKNTRQLANNDNEISRLNQVVGDLERGLRDRDNQLNSKTDFQRTHERLRRESDQLRQSLETSERTRDELLTKSKQLENELRAMRREILRREKAGSAMAKPEAKEAPVASFMDSNAELDKLRKEVGRYRMELLNRENNFNRMFSEKQPITVERRLARTGAARSLTVDQSGSDMVQLRYSRERTVHGGTSHPDYEEDIRDLQESPRGNVSPTHSKSNHVTGSDSDRLPHLTMDREARNRLQRLIKPRPPREVLASRQSSH